MKNLGDLVHRAKTSADGEAFAFVAEEAGLRIGVGARIGSNQEPMVFVEVVLNPFPDRPRVAPEQLMTEGAQVAWLQARGYGITCDEDGTITCERALQPPETAKEIRILQRHFQVRHMERATA